MLRQGYRVDLNALMRMYETNYAKLLRLMPRQDDVGEFCVYEIQGNEFQVDIVESTRYTTLLDIWQRGDVPEYLRPRLVVRMYHDARVADVCTSQSISQIQPRYDYPNPRMLQQDEKHQINAFLSDWLGHCLRNGITKHDAIY
ncbi:dehydrogenase [Enterovibrio norvegicus]|uniref:Dehydrogenase n=2 Tax=Enterovibrio norvegicus TaxID=188144 RepID=A0A1I5T7A8_9GAMM|nr:DUF1249 domain-containing protein [Enterovibrio norvegicus]OEE51433.1 dehydrogenase [Enterovibrio norvegicus]OEF59735.1 dehydrogenase [Enterovibrio norvegicus]PMH64882.1 dehydrogenase [Enterovibrio norvegicus]PMI34490.1 dehydrogenase [Enterovibrio norvegicus]PMN93434.1 dehydrogenase [Enterovibrio norvegicus]